MCSGCRALRQVFKGLLLLVAVDVLLSCLYWLPAVSACFAQYHASSILPDAAAVSYKREFIIILSVVTSSYADMRCADGRAPGQIGMLPPEHWLSKGEADELSMPIVFFFAFSGTKAMPYRRLSSWLS